MYLKDHFFSVLSWKNQENYLIIKQVNRHSNTEHKFPYKKQEAFNIKVFKICCRYLSHQESIDYIDFKLTTHKQVKEEITLVKITPL